MTNMSIKSLKFKAMVLRDNGDEPTDAVVKGKIPLDSLTL